MPKATWDDSDFGGSVWEDELDDFPVYDGELPPKGVYRFVLKRLQLTQNKNKEPMLKGLLILNEPAGSKKSQYNGKDVWFNLNVTKQGAPWVNNFISNLVPEGKVAAIRKAFWGQKVMLDKSEPPTVTAIGAVKIVEGMLISAQCAHKTYNNDTDLDAKRFLRPSNTEVDESDAADDNEEEWEETDGEEGGEDEAAEDGEGDEEYEARGVELDEMERPVLLKIAKGLGLSVKRGTPEAGIVTAILDAEFPEDEEPEDEDEAEEDFEDEEPEEEPEPEPEPAPKPTRRRPAKAAAPAKEEAPARPRTGTRRRKGGEPPF